MKLCPNSECPSFQQNRAFLDTDNICPRCGEPLQDAANQAYAATAPTAAAQSTLASELALLGAAGTLILAGLIIAVLVRLEVIHRGGSPSGRASGTPALVLAPGTPFVPSTGSLPPVLSPAQASATAGALATAAAQGTPVGGFSGGTATAVSAAGPQNRGPATATLPPGLGTNGLAIASGGPGGLPPGTAIGTNVTAVRLCQRIATGQPCIPVTTYAATDTFYLAVEANFGPGAVQTVRVRLNGPPDGSTQLLSDQTSTPGRDGRFWVGFAFAQNQPWLRGVYRAEIFVNAEAQRSAFVEWTVP